MTDDTPKIPFVESPSAYTTSFQRTPDAYVDEPNSYTPQDVHEPILSRLTTSRESTISRDSQHTVVDTEPALDEAWGEEKRIWISANSSPHSQNRRRRTLVLCFDGTGDQFDGDVLSSQLPSHPAHSS